MSPDPLSLAVYVHWPFCQAKCPYCDFNSHVSSSVDHEAWRDALVSEIEKSGRELPDRTVTSVFFGGGTPSLMRPETVDAVLGAISRTWRQANDIEITLEANPTSVESGRLESFRLAGINRVSIGLQALRDRDLKALGRLHTAAEGLIAIETARALFDRTSFDLIYARQDQSLKDWEGELIEALERTPDHLSLYQLTIEPGTAFGDRYVRGKLPGLPTDDLSADMYELTQEICASHGLPAYEVSNHARPGAESTHNLTYWRSGDWVGIGPGAHGRFTKNRRRIATEALLNPAKWLAAALEGNGERDRFVLDTADTLSEKLMMGLRLTEGVALRNLDQDFFDRVHEINGLGENRLLEWDGDILKTTPSGRPLLNAVLQELLAYTSPAPVVTDSRRQISSS